jgi:hypothetical protein
MVVAVVCLVIALLVGLGATLLLPPLIGEPSPLTHSSEPQPAAFKGGPQAAASSGARLRHYALTAVLTVGVVFYYAATCLVGPGTFDGVPGGRQ